MPASYQKLLEIDEQTERARFAKDVFLGLMRTQKVLQSKYMYDTNGSKIYEEIMDLKEYYLVESEYDCLDLAKEELSKEFASTPINLIELGSGNAYKTKLLIKQFVEDGLDFTYIPVDISEGAMKDLISDMEQEFPNVEVKGYVADYFDALEHLHLHTDKSRKNVVLFLGSNIGNFTFEEATDFIFSLWRSLNAEDMVLMGFDLRKSFDIMIPAYNDPQGVTKRFNLNLLERINRELGGQFDLSKWEHYEPYDVHEGSMKSYLISLEDQEVRIQRFNKAFHFRQWEPIYIEQSYKYTAADIKNLASITGFKVEKMFSDSKNYYVNSLWCVDQSAIRS